MKPNFTATNSKDISKLMTNHKKEDSKSKNKNYYAYKVDIATERDFHRKPNDEMTN